MKSPKEHIYSTRIEWTGNRGSGTKSYRGYDRNWNMAAEGKAVIACSNDPLLGGNPGKYNPEDLLLAALSSCHMLWYLHLCSDAGISVETYEDVAEGKGEMEAGGKGRFLSATLKPKITIAHSENPEKDLATAHHLHEEVHAFCFIARSVNFPVYYAPEIKYIS
jgi:organic hydroperoxide reductase OsmC/OhrA